MTVTGNSISSTTTPLTRGTIPSTQGPWGQTWDHWNNQYILTTSTSTVSSTAGTLGAMAMTTSDQIWGQWNLRVSQVTSSQVAVTQITTQLTSAGATTTNQVWGQWNTRINNLRDATQEEVRRAQRNQAVYERELADYQREQARITEARSKANDRAENLLRENLSAAQREELTLKGFFTLKTIQPSGEERVYRIGRGRSRNVQQVDASGRVLKTLCAHPTANVPDADTMLSQKLMLETQETDFLRIANHS